MLDSPDTPSSLRSFDEAVLGWGGGCICLLGVIFNLLLITVLVREKKRKLVYNVVLAIADVVLLVVWGKFTFFSRRKTFFSGGGENREFLRPSSTFLSIAFLMTPVSTSNYTIYQ